MPGFVLPPQVDPNYRVTPGDPNYGINAFGAVWHDLWQFLTQIAGGLYVTFRAIEDLANRS